jgi:hypothetical protein
MTTVFSDDLRQAIEKEGGNPVQIVDTGTNQHCVLMRADQYGKVKAEFEHHESEFDPREAYPLVDELTRTDDAEDRSLASYQSVNKQEP